MLPEEFLAAAEGKPRYHANGFIQLEIVPMKRLHVWSRRFPMPEDNNAFIHDHVWGMYSTVLLGVLRHDTWHEGNYLDMKGYDIYSVGVPGELGFGPKLEGAVPITRSGSYIMQAGSSYYFAADRLHSSHPSTPYVATLMEKEHHGRPYEDRPRVACPVGQAPFDAFDPRYAPTQEEMHEELLNAVKGMSIPHYRLLLDKTIGSNKHGNKAR